MTLGWRVSVYRQVEDRASPSADHDPTGIRVAIWRAHAYGLDWLKDLAASNDAVHLADNSGYPIRYTVRAQALLPVIQAGPPRARTTGVLSLPGDTVDLGSLPGGVMIDQAAIEDCQAHEWLQIEAWDES